MNYSVKPEGDLILRNVIFSEPTQKQDGLSLPPLTKTPLVRQDFPSLIFGNRHGNHGNHSRSRAPIFKNPEQLPVTPSCMKATVRKVPWAWVKLSTYLTISQAKFPMATDAGAFSLIEGFTFGDDIGMSRLG